MSFWRTRLGISAYREVWGNKPWRLGRGMLLWEWSDKRRTGHSWMVGGARCSEETILVSQAVKFLLIAKFSSCNSTVRTQLILLALLLLGSSSNEKHPSW